MSENKSSPTPHALEARPTSPFSLGEPLEQRPSAEVLDRLWHRRSCSAMTLQAPGPSEAEIKTLIEIGLRVPDHGKLGPWRIVRFTKASKARLVEALTPLANDQSDPKKALAALQKLERPPEALLVISSPVEPHPIPVWEQHLSSAAICQNLLIAAAAMGYGANWITDWYAYDPMARALLGLRGHEKVAGFIYLGTASEPPLERERPDYGTRVRFWMG